MSFEIQPYINILNFHYTWDPQYFTNTHVTLVKIEAWNFQNI